MPCTFPSADRCAGWNAANGTVQCGVGYDPASPLCGSCLPGYYPDPNGCWPCPVKASEKYTRVAVAGFVVVMLVLGSAAVVGVVMKNRQGRVNKAVMLFRAVRFRWRALPRAMQGGSRVALGFMLGVSPDGVVAVR